MNKYKKVIVWLAKNPAFSSKIVASYFPSIFQHTHTVFIWNLLRSLHRWCMCTVYHGVLCTMDECASRSARIKNYVNRWKCFNTRRKKSVHTSCTRQLLCAVFKMWKYGGKNSCKNGQKRCYFVAYARTVRKWITWHVYLFFVIWDWKFAKEIITYYYNQWDWEIHYALRHSWIFGDTFLPGNREKI